MQSPIYKVHDALSNSYNIVDNLNLKIEISNGSSNICKVKIYKNLLGKLNGLKHFNGVNKTKTHYSNCDRLHPYMSDGSVGLQISLCYTFSVKFNPINSLHVLTVSNLDLGGQMIK